MSCWELKPKSVAEVRNAVVDFQGKLSAGEILTGTPTVTSVPTGLTFANIAVNTVALTVNDVAVAIGEAVQFKVSGGTAGTRYTLVISAGTNATPAQTLEAIDNEGNRPQLEVK